MPPVTITETFKPRSREEWRAWLGEHGQTKSEIWVLSEKPAAVSYLDLVEEALCFGWIDGIGKRFSEAESAQRFSPRKPKSNWTELNKARARRLIRLGLMTPAGAATLPDLDAPFEIPRDIHAALSAEGEAWAFFSSCSELYQRVRVGYVDEARKQSEEFARRLTNLLRQSAAGKQFGNWDDGGRLSEELTF